VAFHNWFRWYSIGTLLTFGLLTVFGLVAQTARVGLQERTMIYGCLLWVALLAIVLLGAETGTART
jgi:formate/nitrite transporter FocA (FNT family)